MTEINQKGFGTVEIIMVIVILSLIGAVGYLVYKNHHQPTKTVTVIKTVTSPSNTANTNSNTKTTVSYAILSPATVQSKTAECSQTITKSQDGDASPVSCSNGDLNIDEWNYLKTLTPSVMTLGYDATETQIKSAVCADIKAGNSSYPVESTTYEISALYYGWSFNNPVNPNMNC